MSTPPDDGGGAAAGTTRPWSEFLDTTAISIPVSLTDATSRIAINLSYFKLNYLHLTLTIFFISLFFHPLSLLILFVPALAWHFLFFNRLPDASFEVAGFYVSDVVLAGSLAVVTVVAMVFADVWVNLFVSVAVSVVVVLFHAVVRVSSFGDENPYGGLLDAEAGGYSEF